MKSIFTILILTLLSIDTYSQITLEKEYIYGAREGKTSAFIANNNLYFFEIVNFYQTKTSTFLLYDGNHQLVKSSIIQIENYGLYRVYLPSDKLFNDDSLIEFIATYKPTTGDNTLMAIFNEDGEKLFDLGSHNFATYIKTPSNQYKLLTHYIDDGYGMNVYSLPGSLTSSEEEILKKAECIAFPNPAKEYINIQFERGISSQLIVTDIKGNVVKEQNINPAINEVRLNTSNFTSGLYIYQIGDQKGKFIIK
ncbi:T9SS type A sorting domain-containing protein [Plebeiibacterium sediminum]|uniref:T9SS type A sorting domain-containing protein n=1 Tax=Plebeiibacterium sediminum TaxID=2992112 RepID=A0AAE3M9A7_9BACT|nr:T9SS type A sorting domain-containing protein [Plebeiobacterium sediminum]MCW3789428.1 T9SS type A sorting domain-containing protein [Plebeiobacterium sediminum]